ncbi:NAD(P)H-binding protein [Gloeobacter morelensis]|uniref:NAD(P)H-binding protein n=1 Tax=Gloeobacter morelensis MG652769 TaxID=2781736 RepID=A0ABY3PKP4_9CYAN|nr:NAD(P)H-binding protein [Gloeobacter morelensis]UFP94137.1 NAD(P)H-binding protein [Gloeobacter morelensis MG652769]
MKILVMGATGNLGRQVVRRAIDEGHTVRCGVRNREKAQFLEQWGAQLFGGDLREADCYEPLLADIEAVILTVSALASRDGRDKTNNIDNVDDVGVRAFVDAMRGRPLQRLVYTSVLRCDEFAGNKMMCIKRKVEEHIERSGVPYSILRLSAFMQGLIPEFALPILEKKPVRIQRNPSPIAYISTLDAAKFAVAACTLPALENRTVGVSGPEVWDVQAIIKLCDDLSGIKQMPKVSILSEGQKRINELLARMLNPNLIELLRFSEAFATGQTYSADMEAAGELFGIPATSLTKVEPFLQEYFAIIKRRLREKNYQEPKIKSPF